MSQFSIHEALQHVMDATSDAMDFDKPYELILLCQLLLESYDSDEPLTDDEILERCKECMKNIKHDRLHNIETLTLEMCNANLNRKYIDRQCELDCCTVLETKQTYDTIFKHMEEAYNAYKANPDYEIRFCWQCGALMMPTSDAWREGYHFDTCI